MLNTISLLQIRVSVQLGLNNLNVSDMACIYAIFILLFSHNICFFATILESCYTAKCRIVCHVPFSNSFIWNS